MSLIRTKTVKWDKPSSSEVIAHYVYVHRGEGRINYTDPRVRVLMPECEVKLPGSFPVETFQPGITYKIGVSAADEQDNESDIVEVDYPFDFVPPDPPTGLKVV